MQTKYFMFAIIVMKQIRLLISLSILLSSSVASYAQDTTLARLQSLPNDTVKVNRLLAYGRTLRGSAPGKATAIYNEAIGLAQKIKDEDGVAHGLLYLGYINLSAGNYIEYIQQVETAISIFSKLGNVKEVCNAQLDLSAGFNATGQWDSAIYYCMTALKVLESRPYIKERTRAYLNLGTQYNNLHSYAKAISYQKQALQLATEAKDSTMLLNIYSALSLSYDNGEDKQQAFDMASRALPYLTPNSNKTAACRIYDQYAYSCIGVHKYNEAMAASQKAMALAKEIKDVNHYGTSVITLAKAYAGKGDYTKTIALLNELQSSENANSSVEEDFYRVLADAYYNTGNYKRAAERYGRLLPMKEKILFSIAKPTR